MENKKKRVCLVTTWYPTKENPYVGLFFKEQAFAVRDYFDFLVVHLYIRWKKKPGRSYSVERCNVEDNTVEYNVKVSLPVSVYLADAVSDFKKKKSRKERQEGVGKYVSIHRKKVTYHALKKIFMQKDLRDFDVLYCVDAQKEAQNLKMISEITGKPYVIGEHAPFPWPGQVISDFAKEAIEKANLYLAISHDKIRQMLLQNIKLPRTVLIGNLVDESQFLYRERTEDDHIKTFVIVAAHVFYKNYDLLIAVMDRLTEIAGKPFKIMVVGYAANKGYSKNIEILEEKIRNSKFAHAAELIPSVRHEHMGEIYNRADAFVMTSIQEGMPVSALEAACCGLPLFSTMCGGVEDYVTDKIGRIYKVTDCESFAQGLKEFLEGKTRFDSEYIRNYVVERYGKEAFVENFISAMNGVIEGKK